jgi:hypothetical protein
MITKFLFNYLTERSRIKGVQLVYSREQMEQLFLSGIRTFAGVTVNDFGFPLFDDEPPVYGVEPGKHFLNNYIYWNWNSNETNYNNN